MPTAVAILGITSDQRLLIRFIFLMMTKSGIAPASALIAMVATTKAKSFARPGKRYFANANPASAQKKSVVIVPSTVVKPLLKRFVHTGMSSKSLAKFASVACSIVSAANPEIFSPTDFTEMKHIQRTGKRQSATTSIMKAFTIIACPRLFFDDISHPLLASAQPVLDHRYDKEHEDQDDTQCRCISEIERLEAILIYKLEQ